MMETRNVVAAIIAIFALLPVIATAGSKNWQWTLISPESPMEVTDKNGMTTFICRSDIEGVYYSGFTSNNHTVCHLISLGRDSYRFEIQQGEATKGFLWGQHTSAYHRSQPFSNIVEPKTIKFEGHYRQIPAHAEIWCRFKQEGENYIGLLDRKNKTCNSGERSDYAFEFYYYDMFQEDSSTYIATGMLFAIPATLIALIPLLRK